MTAGDSGGEVVLTLGIAQNRLSHWAPTGGEKRRKRGREKRSEVAILLAVSVAKHPDPEWSRSAKINK